MEKTNNTLCQYAKLYNTFANELRYAGKDYEFKAARGELRYAVDFSEIFAFILPAKSYKDFFLFNEGMDDPLQAANLQALHQLLMKHLFFELSSPHKLLLLPPYIEELNGFISDLLGKTLDHSIDLALKFFIVAQKKIMEQENTIEIKKIIERIDLEGIYALSHEEQDRVVNFAQEYGPFLALSEEINGHQYSLNQLRRLLKKGESVFETLDEFAQENQIDLALSRSDVYTGWYSYLLAARGPDRSDSANVDASAIDQLSQINQYLQCSKENMRVLLFTRSYLMNTLFDEEYEQGKWHNFGDYPLLRHPRVYSVLSILEKFKLTDPEQLTKDELAAIDEFTRSIAPETPDSQAIPEELEILTEKIENDWKKAQALVLSAYEARTESSEVVKEIDQTRKILNLLNSENIRKLINSTLDNLLKEIEFSYDLLESSSSQSSADQDPSKRSKRRPTTQSIPCYLRFSSDEAQNLVKGFGPGKEYELRNVIEAFNMGFNKDFNQYERFLAMAYILGVLNKWGRAKSFCEHAISLAESENQAANEGDFFLALCLRKTGLDLKSFDEAQRLLERALKVLPNDPRYLTEKGSQIIRMHLFYPQYKNDIPVAQTGLFLLFQAEANLDPTNDKELHTQILNNRLYYNISQSDYQKNQACENDLNALKRIQAEIEPNSELWPSYILDSIAWGEWLLHFDEVKFDINKKSKIIHYLEIAVRSDEITDTERQVRIDHLNAVRVGVRKVLR